jgi:hypothetical protein
MLPTKKNFCQSRVQSGSVDILSSQDLDKKIYDVVNEELGKFFERSGRTIPGNGCKQPALEALRTLPAKLAVASALPSSHPNPTNDFKESLC